MSKERPIIMMAESVRAILAGRKTQTRRVVKPQPGLVRWNTIVLAGYGGWTDEHGRPCRCPYGKEGDLLWVREAWLPDPPRTDDWPATQFDGCGMPLDLIPSEYRVPEWCLYRAAWIGADLTWMSPMFMPRWASRLTLRVTDVRAERLQDITDDEAMAEGVKPVSGLSNSARMAFARLWNEINAKRGFPWSTNPWVWVVTFEAERSKP